MTSILNQTGNLAKGTNYQTIETAKVVSHFQSIGYDVTHVIETKPRKVEKIGFQKHMVRLRHKNHTLSETNTSVPELVIVNSHDATMSLRLMIGIYRMVCANGLIVGSTFEEQRVRHVGDVFNNLDRAIRVTETHLPTIKDTIERWSSIRLTENQLNAFRSSVATLVVPDAALNVVTHDVGQVRRYGDQSDDLWTVYNRMQETALRGGVRYLAERQVPNSNTKRISQYRTRAVRGIDRKVELNKALWDFASEIEKGELS